MILFDERANLNTKIKSRAFTTEDLILRMFVANVAGYEQ